MKPTRKPIPDWLTWVLSALEPLIVLALAFLLIYEVYWLAFGKVQSPHYIRAAQLLQLINDNWKGALLLAIPLFYRPIRTFLEEAEEFFGMKRHLEGTAEQEGVLPRKTV